MFRSFFACMWGAAIVAAGPGVLAQEATEVTEVTPLGADLKGFAYPYEVKEFSLRDQRKGLSMAYMDVPPEKPNGRTVVLMHGKNFSGAYWGPTAQALADRGFRVIVPDQIGFGRSSKPGDYQYTFQSLAEHNRKLLESLGVERASVVGHSMGGMLAVRFALMFPENVERLVLANPIGLEDWKRHVPYQNLDAAYQEELAKTPESIRHYMQSAYFDGNWKPEYDALLALQAGWAMGPDRESLAWVSALTADMIFTQPVVYELGDLKMPVLLIMGDRDRTAIGGNRAPEGVAPTLGRYDQLGRKIAAMIPDNRLVELPGIGHLPQYEDPETFQKTLMEFLDAPR